MTSTVRYPEVYPLYDEPEAFRNQRDRERDKQEAKAYFEWFTAHYSERISTLVTYFDERLTNDPQADLLRIGEKVASCVYLTWCTYLPSEPQVIQGLTATAVIPPEKTLTPHGRSLAIDMGLLLADLILRIGRPSIQWHLVTRPKTDIDFHSPVVKCSEYLLFNPKRGSISELSHVVRINVPGDGWLATYNKYAQQCP